MVMANRSKLNQRFRGAVVGALGSKTKQSLARETPARIQQMFHPSSKGGPMASYPTYQMFHELSKLPAERVFRFVNMNQLKEEVLKQPGVARLVAQHPELKEGLEQSIREATRERGVKGAKFWVRAPKNYIDKIVAGGKGNPNKMNTRAGEIIAKEFSGPVKPRTILDIGTFAGGTITEVVKKLSLEQRKQLNIILVDVAGKTVKNHAVKTLVRELNVPRQNIKVIPASFYSAAVALGEMKRPMHEAKDKLFLNQFKGLLGKVDAVTAGAATINFATDLKPYLKSIQKLLKPGGTFVNWDWGSAESTRPNVNPKAMRKVPIGFTDAGEKVSHYDAYVSFMNFWFRTTLRYPETVTQKFIADLNASKKFNSFNWLKENASWAESERERIRAMQARGELPKYDVKKDENGKVIKREQISYKRVSGPLPFRNRAYRTPGLMYREAVAQGFEAEQAKLPFAKPSNFETGKINLDTGNNTWMMVMRKK